MAVDEKNQEQDKITEAGSVVLNDVKIKTIEKVVQVPKFIDVKIDRPIYIDKEYERPVVTEKEYEKPIAINKEHERPVCVDRKYERPVVTDKEYERPVVTEKEYERPVCIDKEHERPVVKNIPYNVPEVNMIKVQQLAEKARETLQAAEEMLNRVNKIAKETSSLIDKVKEQIPEEIKMPRIVEDPYEVSVPKYVPQRIEILGKVVSKGDM